MGAFAHGFDIGINTGARGGAYDKHANLSDEERETALGGYNDSIAALQGKMSQDPANAAAYQSQLQQVVADRTDLFHPRHGPGALAALGKRLWQAAHGSGAGPTATPAPPASTVAPNQAQPVAMTLPDGTVLPAQTAADRSTVRVQSQPAGPARMAEDLGYGAQLPPENEVHAFRAKMVGGGFSEADADKATRIHFGLEAKPVAGKPTVEKWKRDGQPYKGQDGKWYERQVNEGGEFRQQALGDNFQPPTNMKKSQFEREMGAYAASLGKNLEDLTFEEYQNGLAGLKQATSPDVHSTRETAQIQANGDIVKVPLSTTSSKRYPGAGGGARSAPAKSTAAAGGTGEAGATPGALKTKARKTAGPPSAAKQAANAIAATPDPRVIGHRNTTTQNKAEEDVRAATKLITTADLAAKHPSAGSDKKLALDLVRGSAGRVNLAEINMLIHGYGLGTTLEQYANNVSTGELPANVRAVLVNLAHDNLTAANAARDEVYQGSQGQRAPAKSAAKTPAKSAGKQKQMSDDEFLMGVSNAR